VRPAVVVSDDELNASSLEKVVVVPSTTQPHDVPWRVVWEVRTPRGQQRTYFCCEDVRSASTERFRGRIGERAIPLSVMQRVEAVLRRLLALDQAAAT